MHRLARLWVHTSSSWLESKVPTAFLPKPDAIMTMGLLLLSSGHEEAGTR